MTYTCKVTGSSLVEKMVKKVNLFCIFDQYDQMYIGPFQLL